MQRTKELEPSVTMQYDTANVPEPTVTMQYDAANVPDLSQSITRFDVYESSTGVEALYGFRSLVLGVLGVVGILVLFTSHALKLVRTDPLPQQPGVGERCIRCFRVMAHDVGSSALAHFPPAIADILQKMMTHSRRKSRTIFVQLLFLDFLFLHRDKHKRLEGLVSKVLLTLAGGKLVIFAIDQTGRQRKRVAVQNVDDVPDDMQVLLFEFWDGEAYAADMDVFEGIDEYAGVLHGVQALPHPLGIPRNGASSTGRELRKLLADVRDQAARDGNEGPLVITAETQLPTAQLGALIAELQATFCRHANDFFVAGVQTGHDFGSGAEGLPGVTTPADSQSKLMSIPHFNSRFSGREDEPIPDSAYAPVGSSTRRVRRLGGAQGSFVVDASGVRFRSAASMARQHAQRWQPGNDAGGAVGEALARQHAQRWQPGDSSPCPGGRGGVNNLPGSQCRKCWNRAKDPVSTCFICHGTGRSEKTVEQQLTAMREFPHLSRPNGVNRHASGVDRSVHACGYCKQKRNGLTPCGEKSQRKCKYRKAADASAHGSSSA